MFVCVFVCMYISDGVYVHAYWCVLRNGVYACACAFIAQCVCLYVLVVFIRTLIFFSLIFWWA